MRRWPRKCTKSVLSGYDVVRRGTNCSNHEVDLSSRGTQIPSVSFVNHLAHLVWGFEGAETVPKDASLGLLSNIAARPQFEAQS
jgi:hypothetical protein